MVARSASFNHNQAKREYHHYKDKRNNEPNGSVK
jgi:hypothetical protein